MLSVAAKQRCFRFAAVIFGLSLIVVVEGALRFFDVGRLADTGDPYVGFHEIVPLFQLNTTGTHYETAKARQLCFRPDSFLATKPSHEFRAFCLGGSTVQGRPYAIETSFSRWLELSLQAADPDHSWRIVNCGGISYASYRLIPILQECLQYEPDLFIIYTGQNEFLEERTYEDIKYLPSWQKGVLEFASQFRLYTTATQLVPGRDIKPKPTSTLPREVDALLDYQGGLATYHRDDDWHRGVTEHYEQNLRRMVHLARNAGVPIVLMNPVSNLSACPPFKVEVAKNLTAFQQREFETRWETAKSSSWEDLDSKLQDVDKVLQLDPRHAEAQYLQAKVLDAMGQHAIAKLAYQRAKDEDICPLRMTEKMHEAVFRVAKQSKTPLVDVRARFEELAETGIPGDDELIDHVHPRIPGHKVIAQQLFEFMCEQNWVRPRLNWEASRQALYEQNFVQLPDSYFPESQARLEGLQGWAAGRAQKLRLRDK